ncbi:MAG: adenosine deaminase [Actinomycetota bacterium]
MDLRNLPKAELHRHLEGAVRLATILDVCREAGDPLPESTPEELAPRAQVRRPMGSLEEVLAYFRIAQGAFRDYEAVERISYEAVEDLAADCVRLAELRFSPDFLCRPHGLDWDRAMDAIVAGIERGAREHDVAVGLIAIVSRSFGMESAERTVAFALRHRERLVGFDLADEERSHPPGMYTEVLAPLADAELPITAHYGESAGPEFPREAIEVLGVVRLGHGVSVAHDATVTALARDRGVTLEMCPTSNVRTNAVGSLAEHPARRLLHEGLRVTINTDDPGLFGIDLTNELTIARDELGFEEQDLRLVTENALEASFIDDETKARTRARHFAELLR